MGNGVGGQSWFPGACRASSRHPLPTLRPEVWREQDSAGAPHSVGIPRLQPPPSCPQATVLCDLLLLHILPKRHYYKQKKFKYAEDMGPEAVGEVPESGPSEAPKSVGGGGRESAVPLRLNFLPLMLAQGERDPAATSSTLILQENMKTS